MVLKVLTEDIDKYLPERKPKPGEDATAAQLTMKVTRSPCPMCARSIDEVPDGAKERGYTLRAEIYSLGRYQGKAEDPLDNTSTSGIKTAIKGLTILREGGARLDSITLTDAVIVKLASDPNFKHIDPRKSDFEQYLKDWKIGPYKKTLDEVLEKTKIRADRL